MRGRRADLLPERDPWDTLLVSAPQTRCRLAAHGGHLSTSPRARVASASRLDRSTGDGWIAVGDAALAFDPLSSYGITSAMGTAFYGAHAVADAMLHETMPAETMPAETWGDVPALAVYERLLDRTWIRYVREHEHHYGLERRWSDRPFWCRRSAAARHTAS
jgi:flavin-dependent dehydrogenase